MEIADKEKLLDQLADKISQCQKCPLWEMAKSAVAGEGNPEAEIFFIGEAPGFHEDQQGRPFVGAAGRLLSESLSELGLKRQEVFIGNMIKHRPPGNRDPEPLEIDACRPWLEVQLAIVDPKLIVTLGRFSLGMFLPGAKISQSHGQPKVVGSRLVLPLYHPAAALRSERVKQDFKEDFQKIPRVLKDWQRLESRGAVGDRGADSRSPEEQLSLI